MFRQFSLSLRNGFGPARAKQRLSLAARIVGYDGHPLPKCIRAAKGQQCAHGGWA